MFLFGNKQALFALDSEHGSRIGGPICVLAHDLSATILPLSFSFSLTTPPLFFRFTSATIFQSSNAFPTPIGFRAGRCTCVSVVLFFSPANPSSPLSLICDDFLFLFSLKATLFACAASSGSSMLRRTLGRRMMQLHAQPTPNPLCRSFSIPADGFESFVPEGQSCEVAHRGLAWVHPLSQGLFEQYPQEVMSVFVAPRQVSISLYPNVDWSTVEWSISSFLGHYLVFHNACISPAKEYTFIADDLEMKDGDSEVLQCIKELLREQVRPMVQRDGGDVKLLHFNEKTGVVSLAMLGACRTCPSSHLTLKDGIERVMKHFLPEVTEVVEARDHQFYADYGLLFDSEKALYKEAARLDRERQAHMRHKLTPTILSYDSLNEPDGD
ncbi:hypothetical protein LSCM1_00090 [Leishmania martiniquensis]|uniref:Scaffold protein Nfu/NifU N-terminal domain-containing protein n=1 Tax=Leishmania martiniquensis TaxID=1580590 RepID=A0A836FJW5_9TRYP|nr:hypothetical protein LSCM1_00090 [Leishmania martiniquensis]